jgi:large subunit ribosomal protein L24
MESNRTKKMRTGDKVIAIAGNNRGLTGTVQSMQGDKVIVQGLNVRKKHVKRTQNAPGGIIEMERPIHVSNLKVCVEGETTAKLKVRTNEQGQREFVYKKDDQEAVYRSTKKPK